MVVEVYNCTSQSKDCVVSVDDKQTLILKHACASSGNGVLSMTIRGECVPICVFNDNVRQHSFSLTFCQEDSPVLFHCPDGSVSLLFESSAGTARAPKLSRSLSATIVTPNKKAKSEKDSQNSNTVPDKVSPSISALNKSPSTPRNQKSAKEATTKTVSDNNTKSVEKKEKVLVSTPWQVKPLMNEGVLVVSPKTLINKGVTITDYVVGTGPLPSLGRFVKVIYQGFLQDGTVFDSNFDRENPLIFRKGTGEVVRGLDIGMEGMRIGGSREIIIPSVLG